MIKILPTLQSQRKVTNTVMTIDNGVTEMYVTKPIVTGLVTGYTHVSLA